MTRLWRASPAASRVLLAAAATCVIALLIGGVSASVSRRSTDDLAYFAALALLAAVFETMLAAGLRGDALLRAVTALAATVLSLVAIFYVVPIGVRQLSWGAGAWQRQPLDLDLMATYALVTVAAVVDLAAGVATIMEVCTRTSAARCRGERTRTS